MYLYYGRIIYLADVTMCIQTHAGPPRRAAPRHAGRFKRKKRLGHFSFPRRRRKLMVYFIRCERLRDFNKTTGSSAISRAMDGETLN